MKRFATSDIEANHWIKFNMIGFYNGEEFKIFSSLKKYLDFVIDKKNSGLRIYFHNGGRYDFLFLVQELLDRKGKIDFISKSSGLLMLKYFEKDTVIEFADSFALLPASLEKLIETYNIKEKKIEIDFKKEYKFSDKRLQEHLKNDCISLYNILDKLKKQEGSLKLTIASQAMYNFEHKFFKGEIWNVSQDFDKYFREKYYKGGRVEVYKNFGKNLYYYDVNSLYPYVMLKKMPVGMPIKTKEYIKNKIGFYEIRLLQDTDFYISILTVKNKKGNFYVNGDNGDIFNLTSVEIKYLIDKKIKFEIIEGYYFEKDAYLFTKYVKYYYDKKVNAKDETERYFAKLMLNSLYGKFGQKLNGEVIEQNTGQGDYPVFDSYNDLLLVDKERKIKFKGVYIAAYITSLARMKHLNLMEKIGIDNIYYCDTDSIICDKKIKTDNKIGGLKIVAKIKEGIFLLPKVYGYIDKDGKENVHVKGFSSKSFSYEDLKKLLLNEKQSLKERGERILGFKECMKRVNNIKMSEGNYLKLVDTTKILENKYTRRKLIKDKKHINITVPFKLNEI